jgi:hypothetical protein
MERSVMGCCNNDNCLLATYQRGISFTPLVSSDN